VNILKKRKVNIGDTVLCTVSGVVGVVLSFYYPTSCEEQTMVLTEDGRKYHAPTYTWIKYDVEPLYGSNMGPGYSTCNTYDKSVIRVANDVKMDVSMNIFKIVTEVIDSHIQKLIKRGSL
jgi:hypothetical protein